ncbi:uncharacterized protein N7500_002144 [Penicillium coprophilum]|uniref:uncharacterized protein n=1 Tax=Penicillium coprophilum TaxID=36646 RepID=UPI00238C592A|nr:uncharacterized protein N7500_002144 [Penicillium coprophilum]KAJ5169361.1 hypothetical protein N7500_002144 [Penicillium coprophilum]
MYSTHTISTFRFRFGRKQSPPYKESPQQIVMRMAFIATHPEDSFGMKRNSPLYRDPGDRVYVLRRSAEASRDKVFLLTMNDGKEVIATLPNPNAGTQYFATGIRVVLDIPAPVVYAWSFSTEDIEAEYIIMKKSRGVELSKL